MSVRFRSKGHFESVNNKFLQDILILSMLDAFAKCFESNNCFPSNLCLKTILSLKTNVRYVRMYINYISTNNIYTYMYHLQMSIKYKTTEIHIISSKTETVSLKQRLFITWPIKTNIMICRRCLLVDI